MSIGAVLPLSVRGSYDVDDLGRTEILFRTLDAFAEPGLFSTFLIVTPPDEVETVQACLAKWQQFNPVVMSEEALIPNLKRYRHMRGWRKQQLVKLAAANKLQEDFYITFDVDVICLKPLSLNQLIINGKALLQYEQRSQHPKWWKASARMLKMSPDLGEPGLGMHITPAILARDLALQVMADIAQVWGMDWVDSIGRLHNPKNPKNLWPGRILRSKWTEYSLYYMCSLKHNKLDQYHVTAGTDANPQLMLIHDSHPYETWNTKHSFSSQCPGMFCVVGSKSMLEPDEVWQRISPFVQQKG